MTNKMKLPEEIGKGLNHEHLEIVLNERLSKVITIRLSEEINDKLIQKAIEMDVPKAFIVQELISKFLS